MVPGVSSEESVLPVSPRRDEQAHHLAWVDWATRAPGENLGAEKELNAFKCSSEVVRAIEKSYIKPGHARKAYEVMLLTAHRESDFNPNATNSKSSATGMFQQIKTFHQRSPLNPPSAWKVDLTVEQRKDVANSAGLFLKQLAHTNNWHEMTIHQAAYEVQKFHSKDMHRYQDPDITREIIRLAGALFPEQDSMTDNMAYSNTDRVKLGCRRLSGFGLENTVSNGSIPESSECVAHDE